MGINFQDLASGNQIAQNNIDQERSTQLYNDRQQAAQQAADAYRNGDIRGAYGILMQKDPEFAQKIAPQLTQIDPELAGQLVQNKTTGELTGQTPFGSNPRQLTDAQGEWMLKAAQAKAQAGQAKPGWATEPGTGDKVRTVGGIPTGEILRGGKLEQANRMSSQAESQASASTQPKQPKLAADEDIDSSGNKIRITPVQQKTIKETRKTFDSQTKDLVRGINDAHTAMEMIDANTPGSQAVEKLRLLRSITPRINQQEFTAFGKGQGVATAIDNAIEEASGKGMSPATQKNMKAISSIVLKNLTGEYDQVLQHTVQRTPEVDPLVLKKRLVGGSGPTPYQAVTKKVSTLPPQDQAAFNWAHDNASDPRAKAILQKLNLE